MAEAYLLIVKMRLLLILLPSSRVTGWLTDDNPRTRLQSSVPHPRGDLLSLFRLALRYQLFQPNCLATSLAQREFLSRHGVPASIHIKVRKERGRLRAHAGCEFLKEPLSLR